jgi:WD40 repeat protein/energy-coupling factor transporter ATP-binding protein EcfA2
MNNPFPGLRPFTKTESLFFFGREIQKEHILNRLKTTNFLAIIGVKGCGKSSLVRCGLVAALHDEMELETDAEWKTIIFNPGENPIDNLAETLIKPGILLEEEGLEEIYRPIIKKTLRNSSSGLAEAIKYVNLPPNVKFLIVIDQFEEIFRYSEFSSYANENKEIELFINLLLEATQQNQIPIYLVITIRSDFLGECTKFTGLPELINDGQYLLPRMAPDEFRFAIEQPVKACGGKISEDLIRVLLEYYKLRNYQLPVFQCVLRQTWDYWQNNHIENEPINIRHYEAIGGIENALSNQAELLFNNLITKKSKSICKYLFTCLIDKISNSNYKRRLCRISELIELTGETEAEIIEVINIFHQENISFINPPVSEKLTKNTIIDLANEDLIYSWKRYQEWVDEEKYSSDMYLSLVHAAKLFSEDKSGLWRPPELNQALIWKASFNPSWEWAKRYSIEFQSAINFLLESQIKFEIDKKHKTKLLKFKRTRIYAFMASLAALIALIFAIMALISKSDADLQRYKAELNYNSSVANDLIFLARDVMDKDPTLAIRLTEKAKEYSSDKKIEITLRQIYSGNNFYKIISKEIDPVTALDISPNGQYILFSCSKIGYLSDLNGEILQKFVGHTDFINSILFAPDGQSILTCSNDSTMKQWNLSGNVLHNFKGHKAAVTSISSVRSLGKIVTTSFDGKLIIWNTTDNNFTRISDKNEIFRKAVISPDEKFILACSEKNITLFNINGKIIRKIKYTKGEVLTIAFSPDGKYFVSGGTDRKLKLWNINGIELHEYSGHQYFINSVCFSPDGKLILSGSSDHTARLWDTEGNELQIFKGHDDQITSVAFFPDKEYLLTASIDGTIRLWNYARNKFIVYSGFTDEVSNVQFSNNSKFIIAGSWDGTVRLWDIWGKTLLSINTLHSKVFCVRFASDGKKFLTCGEDHIIRFWDLSGKLIKTFEKHTDKVNSIAFAPSSEFFVSGSDDKTAILWDIKGNIIKIFKGHLESVTSVAVSPNEKLILTGSRDKTARLWDLDGKLLRIFQGHKNIITSVAFSPDGKYALTGSCDRTACLWEIGKLTSVILSGHEDYISSVNFSRLDSSYYIITASADNTARLWDIQGNELQIFKGHKDFVRSAAFSPDAKFIITGSADNSVRLWKIKLTKNNYFENNDIEKLNIAQSLEYGVLSFEEVYKSNNVNELTGAAVYYLKKSEESKILLEKIELANKSITLHVKASQLYHNQEIRSDLGNAYGVISTFYLLNKNNREAIENAKKGLSIDSTRIWLNTNLVVAYILNDNYEQAIEIFKKNENERYNEFYTFREKILQLARQLEESGLSKDDANKIRRFLLDMKSQ